MMKLVTYLLLFSLIATKAMSQTAHIDDDRIAYKGAVLVGHVSKDDLYEKLKVAAQRNVTNNREIIVVDNKQEGTFAVRGTVRMKTPYHLKRSVGYVMVFNVEDGGYKYRIDSVFMEQKERGGESIKVPSKKILENIEETGPTSVEAEKLLNEIDLRLQKILTLISDELHQEAIARRE